MKYDIVVTSGFQENCYILWDDATMAGIVIDPGDDANEILATIEKRGVKVTAIYNTHGHFDHIGAVHPLQNSLDVPFALHRGDAELAASASTQGQMFGLHLPMSPPKVDVWLEDDMAIIVGEQKGKVLHTPGHTQGGVCFLFSDMVFVGDTLFAGSVGRTDLPGGNSRQLIASIQQKLMSLDDTVKVFPGHGPVTSIGKERKFNPFINYNGTF